MKEALTIVKTSQLSEFVCWAASTSLEITQIAG